MILPRDNEKDLAEVPENLRTAMKLHFVDTMDQVLQIALESPLPSISEDVSSQPIAPSDFQHGRQSGCASVGSALNQRCHPERSCRARSRTATQSKDP